MKFKLHLHYKDRVIKAIYSENLSLLSSIFVTNNAGSGLDERVYLLLTHTTSNHT
jgi:hypothetical protein